jgi:hypothetical protein
VHSLLHYTVRALIFIVGINGVYVTKGQNKIIADFDVSFLYQEMKFDAGKA